MVDIQSISLTNVATAIAAIGGLGTAAAGLIDGSKVAWGGVSNFGLGHVKKALTPFDKALVNANPDWATTVRANWINGVGKQDQKAAAKSLIRLGLSSDNATEMAKAGHVDPTAFSTVIGLIEKGQPLTADQVNLLGRFNAAIDTAMDAGYERGDQKYRNASKLFSGIAAVVLAVWAGGLLEPAGFGGYWFGAQFWRAALVGLIAVPLAPMAKDLASSLQAAAGALRASKS